MLKILDRLIKGREQKLKNNLKKYGLCPNNVTRFWENIGYKEFYFTTTSGVLILKVNRDSREILKFLKDSGTFIWLQDQYININLVRATRRYFSKRPYRLRVYFKDNSKIELSNDFQSQHLQYLNDRIQNLINSNSI